jgi:hypothetical protein
MRSFIAILAAAFIGLAFAPSAASARPFGGGHGFHGGGFHGGGFRHGGFGHRGFGFGPAFAGALAFGAVASSPYWYSSPVGLYVDECFPRRRIIGYTPWGRPIVRVIRTCYY